MFLGQSIARSKSLSGDTAKTIEDEIRRIVTDGYEKARQILTDRNDDWEALSLALLEFETLTGDEIDRLLAGEKIVRDDPTDSEDHTPPSSVPSAGAPAGGNKKDGPTGGMAPQGRKIAGLVK